METTISLMLERDALDPDKVKVYKSIRLIGGTTWQLLACPHIDEIGDMYGEDVFRALRAKRPSGALNIKNRVEIEED